MRTLRLADGSLWLYDHLLYADGSGCSWAGNRRFVDAPPMTYEYIMTRGEPYRTELLEQYGFLN